MLRLTIQVAIAIAATIATALAVLSAGRSAYDRYTLPRATEGQAYIIEGAMELYHLDFGKWPDAFSNAEYARVLYKPREEVSARGDYILESSYDLKASLYITETPPGSGQIIFADMWDRPFDISVENGRPRVVSAGRDGEFGTDDDITTDRVKERFNKIVLPRREERMAHREPPPGAIAAPATGGEDEA